MIRKILLLVCIIWCNSIVKAQQVQLFVQQVDGINALIIEVDSQSNLEQLAVKYNVAIDLLGMYNQSSATKVFSKGEKIIVPLTETNYFKNTAVVSKTHKYEPVFFKAENNETMLQICKRFLLSENTLRAWNVKNNNSDATIMQVGWLKCGGAANEAVNAKVYDYYNPSASNKYGYKKEDFKRDVKNVTGGITKTFKPKSKKTANADTFASKENIPEPEAAQATNVKGPTTSTKKDRAAAIKKKSSDVQEEVSGDVKEGWQQIKGGVGKAGTWIKKQTKSIKPNDNTKKVQPKDATNNDNDLVKEVIDYKQEVTETNSEATNNDLPSGEDTTISDAIDVAVSAPDEAASVAEEAANAAEEAAKIAIEHVKEAAAKEPDVETTKINVTNVIELQKGSATWFYSGGLGSTYGIFTNVAPKGTLLKVFCEASNKTITAKVLGTLNKSDIEEGTMFIIGDNAKAALGASSKVIEVSVSDAN
jgi:hypothetical protein